MSLGGGRGPPIIDAAGALRGFVREAGGCAVLDGALGTELEAHGADLHDALWSAKCLASAPHVIRKVHPEYLEAGADVIISASYQVRMQTVCSAWRRLRGCCRTSPATVRAIALAVREDAEDYEYDDIPAVAAL